MSAVVWLVLGLALIGAEVLTVDLVLVMLGVAAFGAAGVAALDGPVWAQLLVFAGGSAALLLGVRPVAKRHLEVRGLAQGADLLSGRVALVIVDITDISGQVRMDGELWAARPYAGGPPVPAGTQVVVAHVEGVTLHVYPHG